MNPFWRLRFQLAAWLLLAHTLAPGAEMLSVNPVGTLASSAGVGENFCLSADGRYVAFSSASTNLVLADNNGLMDVFVRDCVLRSNIWSTVQTRSSVASVGSYPLDFTPDGRFLLFVSSATNLVTGATNPIAQLYRHDLWSNTTALVSVSADGVNASAVAVSSSAINTRQPRISADGRFVIFLSTATDLVAGVDTGNSMDAFCRDIQNATTELISASPAGLALDRATSQCFMSSNGRYFAFVSAATNVVPGLANNTGRAQVYWRDRLTGTNTPVSINAAGTFSADNASLKSLSRDGRYICFDSLATDIISAQNDFNGTQDLFIHDIIAGESWLVTRATNGNTTGSRVNGGEFSANGEWMLLAPTVADLVPGVQDINGGSADLYLHHLARRTNILVTRSLSGLTGASSGVSDGFARLSASGNLVLFTTSSTNLLSGATTAVSRLLLHDKRVGQNFNPVPHGPFVTPPYNEGRFAFSDDESFVYFLASANYDPAVTDNNAAPDLFRARLRAPQLQPPLPGQVIQAEGMALATYVLQTSSNVISWVNVATNTADSNGVFTVSDPLPPGSQRFYRLTTP